MPPLTLVTMPLEIYGYTLYLSIKTALLRDNLMHNNVQKQSLACSYTLSRNKDASMPHSVFVQ